MRLRRSHDGALKSALFATLIFCVTLTGCDNFCLAINSNPGGTVGTTATCTTTKTTGNVRVSFGSPFESSSDSVPVRPPHIFVTLRGIDALPAGVNGADESAWQPLAPQLAERPVQIDLNSRTGDFCATRPLGAAAGPPSRREDRAPEASVRGAREISEPGESSPLGVATIPAGAYSQLRLRVIPNLDRNSATNSAAVAPLLSQSACGRNLLNCLIPPGAAALPISLGNDLQFVESGGPHRSPETGPGEIAIPSERIAGGSFRVRPDAETHLAITLDLRSTIALPAGDAVRLAPAFSVSALPSCPD